MSTSQPKPITTPAPNDQRSDVKNPNNSAHQADRDNRSRQLNPQDPKSHPAKGR